MQGKITQLSRDELAHNHAIDKIETAHPFYGSRRLTEHLRRCQKIMVDRETVQRHMHEIPIAGICPGPNLSKRNAEQVIYLYLLRHVTAGYANHG
jgi:putative transposase